MHALHCDMSRECAGRVTHIDEKGFVYCSEHGPQRRLSGRRCRKLRAWELAELRAGRAIRYTPGPKPKPAAEPLPLPRGITPGPWHYSSGAVFARLAPDGFGLPGYGVATRCSNADGIPPTERDANMRLCAAAPALYAALVRLVDCPDLCLDSLEPETIDACEQARAALRVAATGKE